MSYETINTLEAVNLFQQLLQPDSQIRVLRLVGNAKMGKSHLLTKVFPVLASQEHKEQYAILDLRNQMQTVPDILHMACSQLGVECFENYYAAHQAWTNRPKVNVAHIFALFASLNISAKNSPEDPRNRDRHLTTEFVKDLSKLHDKSALLLFDSVNNATEEIQAWLMDIFLVQVSQLAHVRAVIAGRSLPEANGSYRVNCRSYQLQPVTTPDDYLAFCHRLNARLDDQSIRNFALATDYTPGIFAELVLPKFVEEGLANG